MQTLILALLLAAVLGFFVPSAQVALRVLLERRPAAIWAFPVLLAAFFAGAAAIADAFSFPLALAILGYAAAPVLVATASPRSGLGKLKHAPPAPRLPVVGHALACPEPAKARPTGLDFLVILLLWLPLEFNAGTALVPRHAQGFLHSVAYGISILLALVIFLCFRPLPGLKYNLPGWGGPPGLPLGLGQSPGNTNADQEVRATRPRAILRDLCLPVAGFAVLAPVLAVLGIAIGFLPPPHLPVKSAGAMAGGLGVILVGTALPEETLFRSLIQNFMMLRFGVSVRTLLVASFIFGCAHLDNGPQPLPNWRYMILATIAGFVYGWVFQKSSTVWSSASLHMQVDWTKHFFF